MATWVRNHTGTLPTATNANLTGTVELDNGTAPGDFDPAAVSSVRIQITLAVTAGSFVDDAHSLTDPVGFLTLDGNGSELARGPAPAASRLDSTTSSISSDGTDSTIPTGFTVAQWEGAEINDLPPYSTFLVDMMADGATVGVTAVTVTITYTSTGPAGTVSPPHTMLRRSPHLIGR